MQTESKKRQRNSVVNKGTTLLKYYKTKTKWAHYKFHQNNIIFQYCYYFHLDKICPVKNVATVEIVRIWNPLKNFVHWDHCFFLARHLIFMRVFIYFMSGPITVESCTLVYHFFISTVLGLFPRCKDPIVFIEPSFDWRVAPTRSNNNWACLADSRWTRAPLSSPGYLLLCHYLNNTNENTSRVIINTFSRPTS